METIEEKKYTVMRADDGRLYIDVGEDVRGYVMDNRWFPHIICNPVKTFIDPQNWVEGEIVSDKDWDLISGSLNRIRRVL